MRRGVTLFAAGVLLCAVSYGQEQQSASQQPQDETQQKSALPPPSLGEIARQLKLKKQQKESQLKQAKADATPDVQAPNSTPAPEPVKSARLVTSDVTPERASVTPVSTHSTSPEEKDAKADNDHHQANAEKWKSQIREMKSAIAALQEDIKSTSDSIHYAGANCVANCTQWNDRQQQKQQEVDTMKAQLEEAQKQLEEMQQAARKEGFGSSVYDP
jgi:hypothetical protein